ncbi:MAG: ABC transporter ATP-binding protein [Candidatus Thorarchaeota archaeon]
MEEVTISNLTKKFGELIAVNEMNLEVPAGTIFGLLGPNGAGKSTTTRVLSTLLRPTSGTAYVGGYNVLEEPVKIREMTGVLPEEANHTIYESMTAYENLRYFARLYDVAEEAIDPAIKELLEFMELWDRKDDRAGELSTGNRQRLALCRALLHEPTVLLLDEPTSALDPVASKRVRELILNLSSKYKQTFFINSHNLGEVQRICDKIAIIDHGKILLSGNTEELRATLRGKQQYRMLVRGEITEAEKIAKGLNFVKSVETEIDTLLLEIENPMDNNSKLLKSMLDGGVNVIELAEDEASLEDLYLDVIKGGEHQ